MGIGIKVPSNVFKKGQQAYKENPQGDFNDVTLTPGRYAAILTTARAIETTKGPQVVLDCKVAGESEHAGGRVSIWFSLAEDRIVYLFKCLALLGYEVENLDEAMLAEIFEDIKQSKHCVRLTCKQNGEYCNVYLDKKLDDVEASTETETAADPEAAGGKAGVKEGAHAKADDLEEKTRDELKAIIEEEEVDLAVKKSTTEAQMIEAIRAKRAEQPAGATGDDAPTASEEDGLADLDRAALKQIVEDEEVDIAIKKSTTDDDIRAAITAHREAKGAEGEKEGDPSGAEQSVELEVGMAVKAKVKGKMVEAKVVSIDEKKGEVKVKTKDGAIHKVTGDDLELPE